MLSIGGGGGGGYNLQLYPNFAMFSTLGGINLDHDFVQVSKLNEDQKKSSLKMELFFSPNSGEDQKKRFSPKMKYFFPPNTLRCTPQSNYWGGMHMKTILKLLGGIKSIYCGGIYPSSPPGFGTLVYHHLKLSNYIPMHLLKFKFDLLFVALRCNKRHYIKIVYNSKTKNNFFYDQRLEGTCFGHLVKHPSTMHRLAYNSFRSL